MGVKSHIVSISPLERFCDNCGATNVATARFCQYCATPLPFKDVIGSSPEQALLSGRYQLEKRIGQSGSNTSTVYKAVDTRFNNRPIAIKEMNYVGLTPTLVQKAEESFKREARLLADLLHPNLPRIYDHFTENERSYLVMDFIEGQTLKDYLEKAAGSSLPLEQVLDWGIQICDVLNYLHTHQPPIILRDLKPSNVMISESGHVYLISFGIARFTQSNSLYDLVKLNSSGYTAPELADTSQSTPRSDIYSLGALLHCLLTGIDPSEQPFFFQPASQLNPAVPQELEDLLQQALEMDSMKRPASVQDIVKVLRHIDQQRISGTLAFALPADKTIRSAPKGNQLLQNAYALYAQKRGREALDAYDLALKTESLNPLAWQGRGLSLALSGRHHEALESFERALQLDSSLVASLNGKGTALNLLHRNREALDVFDKAVLLEPDNAVSWNGKGAVLSALEQYDQALTAFDIALHFDGRMAQAWNNKGLVLRLLKRYPEALRAFEQALSFDRNNIAYWNGKGLVLYEMGRLGESLRAYQEVIDRNPNYASALYGMGNVLYAQQKLKSALDHYERAVKADPNFVKAWDRRGNVLGEMVDAPRALESYEKALGIDPRYAPAWNGKASVLSQMGRYDLALDAYEHALRLNPNFPQAWNGKGNAYYQLGDYTHSLESYERALRLNPRLDSALHNKSLALKQLGRYKESLDAAEIAIGLTPNDPDNWQRKAEALRKLHRGKEARTAEAEVARLRISGEL